MNNTQITNDAAATAQAATADVLSRASERARTPKPEPATAPVRKLRKARKPQERKYWLKEAILADAALPLRARAVGAHLAELCDAAEECAFPSHAGLMKRHGFGSVDTVKRAIRDLERAGYFVREMGAGNVGQNKYRPQWGKVGLAGSAMRQRLATLPGERMTHSSPGIAAPRGSASLPPGGVQPCTPGECISAPGGSAAVHPVIEVETKPEWKQKEKRREDAPEGAGSLAVCSEEAPDRPSRGGSAAKRTALPGDFTFDPVDVRAALDRGHTSESIADSLRKFLSYHSAGKMTPDRWRAAGASWIEQERIPQPNRPDPNEMVQVGDILHGSKLVKRAWLKPGQMYTDSRGVRHQHPGVQRSAHAV